MAPSNDEEPRELAHGSPAALRSICSSDSIGRSLRLPLGSPTMPVPPPTSAIGVCPGRCSQAMPITGTRLPDVERVRGRVEADVGRDRALAQPLGEPGRGVLDEAAGASSSSRRSVIGAQSYPLETCPATG